MSIYDYLEKVALKSMPRAQFAEAAVPYKSRKKKYKKFIEQRAKTKRPSDTEYAGTYGIMGGIGGGLMGVMAGASARDPRVALGAGLGGALIGGGIGYLGGLGQASAEQDAIDKARKIVKGGKYDKALQDEIVKYRAYKKEEERREQEARDYTDYRRHKELKDELREIRQAQQNSTNPHAGSPYNNGYTGRRRYGGRYAGRYRRVY